MNKEEAINTMKCLKYTLNRSRYVTVTCKTTKEIIDTIDYVLKLLKEKDDE